MGASITVVDDTPDNLSLMTYLLEAEGHDVAAFSNAEAALADAESRLPDLILLDIQLVGGMDGYEALRRIRAHPKLHLIPVVAVTAFAMVGDREQALLGGFAGYLSKPIDPYAFAAEVNRHLLAGMSAGGTPPAE